MRDCGVPESNLFEITWAISGSRWAAMERLAQVNPPGSEFDEVRNMLRDSHHELMSSPVNFLVDGEPLFGPDAFPFNCSVLGLGIMAIRWLATLANGDAFSRFGFKPDTSNWRVEVRRDGDSVAIGSNSQTQRVLRCSVSDFMAGITTFLDEVTRRLFVFAPISAMWNSLAPLNCYLLDRFASTGFLASGARCRFVYSFEDMDWTRIQTRRALNPPGSTYDLWFEPCSELFGAPLTVVDDETAKPLTPRLRRPRAFRPIDELRRGTGRDAVMDLNIRQGEPWPLLDLALQFATYLRLPKPNKGRLDKTGERLIESRAWARDPSGHRRTPVLDPPFIATLEREVGAEELAITAKEFAQSFVREVHARGTGATSWRTFRILREIALE
jgi:hypothetical protein